jgi:hypothetical protein
VQKDSRHANDLRSSRRTAFGSPSTATILTRTRSTWRAERGSGIGRRSPGGPGSGFRGGEDERTAFAAGPEGAHGVGVFLPRWARSLTDRGASPPNAWNSTRRNGRDGTGIDGVNGQAGRLSRECSHEATAGGTGTFRLLGPWAARSDVGLRGVPSGDHEPRKSRSACRRPHDTPRILRPCKWNLQASNGPKIRKTQVDGPWPRSGPRTVPDALQAASRHRISRGRTA